MRAIIKSVSKINDFDGQHGHVPVRGRRRRWGGDCGGGLVYIVKRVCPQSKSIYRPKRFFNIPPASMPPPMISSSPSITRDTRDGNYTARSGKARAEARLRKSLAAARRGEVGGEKTSDRRAEDFSPREEEEGLSSLSSGEKSSEITIRVFRAADLRNLTKIAQSTPSRTRSHYFRRVKKSTNVPGRKPGKKALPPPRSFTDAPSRVVQILDSSARDMNIHHAAVISLGASAREISHRRRAEARAREGVGVFYSRVG